MPDLRIENLSFTYAGSSDPVLRSIHLTIPEGQFVLVTGPSGGGKSTLALALTGLVPSRIAGHMRGGVYLGANDVSGMEIHEVSQNIGIVFQNPDNQLIQLTVEEEVAFGPENLGLPRSEVARRVEQALIYTGMDKMRKEQIYALSGGQKQRVAISATLAMLPQVLVLDEPTSDLDPVGTQEVLNVLRMLNKQYGMTIVLVEHKVDEVISWVDRVLLMDQGKIIVDSQPRKAFDDFSRWTNVGVSIPQMVQVAGALPDLFQSSTPLSVDEVYEALRGTAYAQALMQRNEAIQGTNGHMLVSPAAQSILSWEAVDLAYGPKQVLNDINLKILPEEWVAVIGANGSGKTSMASLAMGFQGPTRGTIRFRDQAVQAGKISCQAENIAFLFQAADNMLFGATVEKEFLFGFKYQRQRRADKDKEVAVTIDRLIEMIDLTKHRNDNPFHLSHGQRKRLAIGVLLTRQPEALILDEPTTGQDEGHARAFFQFLQYLRENARYTYMMISHEMRAVATYASRVVVLRDGHVFMDAAPEFIFARKDDLALCGILPPPIAQLHGRLCEGRVRRVDLSVDAFLQSLRPAEVTS
jgi:energy-coupling factor transporter ATP-binding protein EcfA2